jgi:hypothetical protein
MAKRLHICEGEMLGNNPLEELIETLRKKAGKR